MAKEQKVEAEQTTPKVAANSKEEEGPPLDRSIASLEEIASQNTASVNENYLSRIKFVKRGREYYQNGDYTNAIIEYNRYFQALAKFFALENVKALTKDTFKRDSDITELLTLTQVFWDLTRVYEKSQQLEANFHESLNNFVNFSLGNRFQVANSEMLRKFIMRNDHNPHIADYKKAYDKLFVINKKCYIATHCFGSDHPYTNAFRSIRPQLFNYSWGRNFITFYYRWSPLLVDYLERHPHQDRLITTAFFKPLLIQLARIISKFKL